MTTQQPDDGSTGDHLPVRNFCFATPTPSSNSSSSSSSNELHCQVHGFGVRTVHENVFTHTGVTQQQRSWQQYYQRYQHQFHQTQWFHQQNPVHPHRQQATNSSTLVSREKSNVRDSTSDPESQRENTTRIAPSAPMPSLGGMGIAVGSGVEGTESSMMMAPPGHAPPELGPTGRWASCSIDLMTAYNSFNYCATNGLMINTTSKHEERRTATSNAPGGDISTGIIRLVQEEEDDGMCPLSRDAVLTGISVGNDHGGTKTFSFSMCQDHDGYDNDGHVTFHHRDLDRRMDSVEVDPEAVITLSTSHSVSVSRENMGGDATGRKLLGWDIAQLKSINDQTLKKKGESRDVRKKKFSVGTVERDYPPPPPPPRIMHLMPQSYHAKVMRWYQIVEDWCQERGKDDRKRLIVAPPPRPPPFTDPHTTLGPILTPHAAATEHFVIPTQLEDGDTTMHPGAPYTVGRWVQACCRWWAHVAVHFDRLSLIYQPPSTVGGISSNKYMTYSYDTSHNMDVSLGGLRVNEEPPVHSKDTAISGLPPKTMLFDLCFIAEPDKP